MTGAFSSPARGFYITHDEGVPWQAATLVRPVNTRRIKKSMLSRTRSGPASAIAATFVSTTSNYVQSSWPTQMKRLAVPPAFRKQTYGVTMPAKPFHVPSTRGRKSAWGCAALDR